MKIIHFRRCTFCLDVYYCQVFEQMVFRNYFQKSVLSLNSTKYLVVNQDPRTKCMPSAQQRLLFTKQPLNNGYIRYNMFSCVVFITQKFDLPLLYINSVPRLDRVHWVFCMSRKKKRKTEKPQKNTNFEDWPGGFYFVFSGNINISRYKRKLISELLTNSCYWDVVTI